MSDEIKNLEKKSKSIMKSSKALRYSRNLMFVVGAMGVTTGVLLSNTTKVEPNKKNKDDNLKNTIDETQSMLKKMRNRNKMYMRGANLELIQLMEQGDQVVKSPWRSWQFGMNFFSNANIVSEGYGDREAMYGGYEGQYIRGNWSEKNLLMEGRYLPGILNQNTGYSLFYSTGKTPNYGFAKLNNINEPEVEIQIMASVRPKSIEKEEILLTPQIDEPRQIVKPEVNLNVNSPLEATDIKFPNVKPVSINVETPGTPSAPGEATAPSMNISLTPPTVQLNVTAPKVEIGITAPNPEISLSPINIPPISKVSAISVKEPTAIGTINVETNNVTPPDLKVNTGELSKVKERNFTSVEWAVGGQIEQYNRISRDGRRKPSGDANAITVYNNNLSDITVTGNNNVISTWGRVRDLDNVSTKVTVTGNNTRAFVIDEGVNEIVNGVTYKPFVYKGDIILQGTKNVGLDLQGTHTAYESSAINSAYTDMSKVVNIKVTNEGTITGENTGGNQKNQVAFGFNNYDRSSNNTRTEMYNSGIVTMKAPESAGIQIRPENSGYSDTNGVKRGLNMMAGINNKIINIEGESSFGILSMKNPDSTNIYTYNFTSANTGTTSSAISTTVPIGGVTASYADKDFESKLEQTSAGEININGNKSIGIGLLNSIQGAYVAGKINIANTSTTTEAVGVYSEVAMKPVKAGEVDDFGILNQTGGIIGSESVEVTGKINIDGSKATKATGARIKDLGKITLKSGGEINIEAGNNVNYGIVSEGISGTRVSNKAASAGAALTTTNENIFGSVDIENGGAVNVKGSNSIGYVLLKGNGSNAGNITVTDTGANSLGFYGVSGVFSNSGKIETTGTNNNGVYLKEDTTKGTLKFTNTGDIIANTQGTVGVYIEKANEFNHDGGVIKAGNGGIGVYNISNPASSNVKIKSEINVAGSTATHTGIGVYSDGTGKTTFNTGAKLVLGEKTVGLYSANASNFENVFAINGLETSIGKGSVLAYFGASATPANNTVNITNATLGNLKVSSMGENSAVFYGDTGTTVNVNDTITIDTTTSGKFKNIHDTAQFLVTNGGNANIASGKTLTSHLKTTISALKSDTGTRGNALNEGTLALTGKDEAIGIYLNGSDGTNATGAAITTANPNSIGMHGESSSILSNLGSITSSGNTSIGMSANNSTVMNGATGTITMNGSGSAGIYGREDSTISNLGNITLKLKNSAGIYAIDSNVTNSSNITAEEGTSAGIYALASKAKDIKNLGTINVGLATTPATTPSAEEKGVGIYAGHTGSSGVLNVLNDTGKNININIKNSVGIYAKNGTGAKTNVDAVNKGIITSSDVAGVAGMLLEKSIGKNDAGAIITIGGTGSAGMFGNSDSEITNKGIIQATNTSTTSASAGMLADTGKAVNESVITMNGGGSAGLLGKNNAIVTNASPNGVITTKKEKSAGIYAENSLPLNEGKITVEGKESAGIFTKNTDAVSRDVINSGTIELIGGTGLIKSAGMYAEIGGSATGTTTLENKKSILVGQEESAGIYIKNAADKSKGVAKNTNNPNGVINLNADKTVGILVDKAIGINESVINVNKDSSAGMFGKNGSEITNKEKINVSHENSAGMYTVDSNATNTANGEITVTGTAGATAGSAGMFGKLTGNTGYKTLNEGIINLNSVTKNVGIYGEVATGATGVLTLENDKKININLGSTSSVGIIAKNNSGNSANLLVNNTANGVITGNEVSSIGILAEESKVTNAGEILMIEDGSVGIYGENKSKVENINLIEISGDKSAGIFLKDSDASNLTDGQINVKGGVTTGNATSAGIYGTFTSGAHNIQNTGTITVENRAGKSGSAGIYGDLTGGTLNITNDNIINANMDKSVGIYAKNTQDVADLTVTNKGQIGLNNTGTTGIFADKSKVTNKAGINLSNSAISSIGIFGQNGADIENAATGNITVAGMAGTATQSSGIYVSGTGTKGTNLGIINLNGESSNGMVAAAGASATNSYKITGNVKDVIGMYGTGTGTKVTNSKEITLSGKTSTGIFTKNGAEGINDSLGVIGLTGEKGVGMFGMTDTTAPASAINLKNKGTINLDSEVSTGIFTSNVNTAITNSTVSNTGTINLNKAKGVGIFTPKSNVTSVGEIKFSADAESSVGVYLTDLAAADASTGNINLGTTSQNRVAYYVKDTGVLKGGNIGTVKGYGVGVYLDNGTLNASTPALNYTNNSNTGDGIIGLLLKGNTNMSGYTGGITVGNTVGNNYAIGIYSDAQGTTATPKVINTAITTGKNGIGLFAENGSKIKYTGNMTIGAGNTAGTGIYIGNTGPAGEGTAPSEVTLETGRIILNGENGVGVIATKDSTINFNNTSTIELRGQGVGIYGQNGAIINDNGGSFITNGHSAERIRLTEGKTNTPGHVTLETGNVLSHVINGEAGIASGATVDAAVGSQKIIGLMADGNKNDSKTGMTWNYTGYDAVNNGTLDLSNATESTAMYLESSRGKNARTIKTGDKSTGIYGIYRDTTPKFAGHPAGYINKSTILNDTGASITVGDSSAAIYSVSFDKTENKGTITGGEKSVGIYATNTKTDSAGNVEFIDKPVNVENTGDITLGNGSAGIYVKPGATTTGVSTVINTGNVTVGDSILNAAGNPVNPAVGIFVEKSNLTTSGDITVGNKGFGFYGSNSTINVNGGNINFSNNGSLAYLENSKMNYNVAGTLNSTSEPLLFINKSEVTLNGNDINVSANGTGAYITGNSKFTGWGSMSLNVSSVGIYTENSSIETRGTSISSTFDKAKGIIARNSNVKNNSALYFSGNESVGIYSKNQSGTSETIENNGNIDISGKKSIGAYLEGNSDQLFVNRGTLNVGATTDPNKNNSTVGIYAKDGSKIDIVNEGALNVADKSFGVYSLSSTGSVTTTGTSSLNVADQAIGIYKKGGSVNLGGTVNVASHTAPGLNTEPVAVYATGGVNVNDTTSNFNVGDKSYGVILNNTGAVANTYVNSAASNITLGNESTFVYSDGNASIVNNGNINGLSNDGITAFYVKNGGEFVNNGRIDLSQGKGNLGALVTGAGSRAINNASGVMNVGRTNSDDPNNIIYGIGIAAVNGAYSENRGNITVAGNNAIGMYGDGNGTVMKNSGMIYLNADSASSSNKIQTMIGVFADNGATFINEAGGVIKSGSYSSNPNVNGLIGVALLNGSTLINHGTIDIDASKSYGVLIRGTDTAKPIIKNYGNITISGLSSYGVKYSKAQGMTGTDLPEKTESENNPSAVLGEINGSTGTINASNGAKQYRAAQDISKNVGGVGIVTLPDGTLAIQRDGVLLNNSQVEEINYPVNNNIGFSNFGVYVDTLGRTKPINISGATSLAMESDLIIGTEFSERTNSKNVVIGDKILKPFLDQIRIGIFTFTPYSGSLTWLATPQVNPATGQIEKVLMTKIPYTAFVPRTDNLYNFTDGLEQRYDMNTLDSNEKRLMDKINSIGNNEKVLLAQAFDEMSGHQYANTQQRLYNTGRMLDKEFAYLKNEWENKSKDSNKIKIFGMKETFETKSAGIKDYTSNSYGVAYVHEDETIKLGNSSGWYAGAVNNRLKFKDIGQSKEDTVMLKLGAFKSTAFDHNGSLKWTVSGEGFVSESRMNRRFLVVDEIFSAKSNYYAYGAAVKNEISKEFRTSERTSIRPYGSFKLEYGKVDNIKEKTGEVRLEVKENDYYSIVPEVGVEFKYRQPFAARSIFIASLGLGYEKELGNVFDSGNKVRVGYTTADWFNIRGEKTDSKGKFKADLNFGIENSRVGMTLNTGYDSNSKDIRGGLGFRLIY